MEIEPDRLSTVMHDFFFSFTAIFFFFRSGERFLSRLQDNLEFPLHILAPRFAKECICNFNATARRRRCIGVKLVYLISSPEEGVL